MCLLKEKVGEEFPPTDDERMVDLLRKKVLGVALPSDFFFIRECNVYETEPWNLLIPNITKDDLKQEKNNKVYFFTRRKPMSERSARPNRFAGIGTWSSTGNKKIMSGDKVIGYKMSLKFIIKRNEKEEEKTNWIMYEYGLSSQHGQTKFEEKVLCSIHQTRRGRQQSIVRPQPSLAWRQVKQGVETTTCGMEILPPTCDDGGSISLSSQKIDASMSLLETETIIPDDDVVTDECDRWSSEEEYVKEARAKLWWLTEGVEKIEESEIEMLPSEGMVGMELGNGLVGMELGNGVVSLLGYNRVRPSSLRLDLPHGEMDFG